jgi:hypothetical protein
MRDLPTGTVASLLTDIEGSTRLGEVRPETLGETMQRYGFDPERLSPRLLS